MRNELDAGPGDLGGPPGGRRPGAPRPGYAFYHVLAMDGCSRTATASTRPTSRTCDAPCGRGQADEEKDAATRRSSSAGLLLLHGDLAAARDHGAVAGPGRTDRGEPLLGQSLLGLAMTALRRHDSAAVRCLAPRAMTAASAMASAGAQTGREGLPGLAGLARSASGDVVTLAKEITGQRAAVGRFAVCYGWAYLWPLVAVHLEAGDIGEAIAASRQLLDPEQQRPPDELESVLTAAHGAWDRVIARWRPRS